MTLQPCSIVGKAETDAGAIHLTREGVPTAGIGLARRYSHTPICTLDIHDAVDSVSLLMQFVKEMGQHTNLEFLG
ncbi:MAG: hypothetical protein A2Y73_07655 [Chloroflexi bacterium RBG_13_56_8]|nr:MAG: hypothetical protein A2Y73_07655 [Chloroflexi bacterium RBG_13_56_8]